MPQFFSEKLIVKIIALVGVFLFIAILVRFAPPEQGAFSKKGEAASKKFEQIDNTVPEISAEGALVRRLKTGETLLAKNEQKIFAVASVIKLMTALLFFERVGPLEKVALTKEAKDTLRPDEKQSKLPGGAILKAEDMLKLLVVESDNDAAYAAAEAVGARLAVLPQGTQFAERISQFVSLMNGERNALGLLHTNFTNPAGRDDLLNYATAEDLFILARAIDRRAPLVWNASRLIEGIIYTDDGTPYHFENTNILLKEFPAIYGSKTGFSDDAGEALLMLYEFAAHDPVVIVVLKSNSRMNDGRTIIKWLENSFQLK